MLAAMIVIAAAVAGIYHSQRVKARSQRPTPPPTIPLDTKTMAPDFEWGQSANGLPQVQVFAKNMKLSADSSRQEFNDLELRLYQKDGEHYDRVRSAYAQLTISDHKFYSPGDAQITIDVPVKGDPPHQLTSITTAAVNFDSLSGQALTDRHVAFTFESGEGTAEGAAYDPAMHALTFNHNLVMNLRGSGANSKPMKVEADQLEWNEQTGVLHLMPWSRLTRDQTIINAGPSTIVLVDKHISYIDTVNVHGTDQQPKRQVEYWADAAHLSYNDEHVMDKVTGLGHAKLTSNADGSVTTMTGTRVDLALTGHSILSSAKVQGEGYLESKPIPQPKTEAPDTKVLRADVIDLQMKPGGKELERVETQTAGTLEFLPNQPSRHRRLLKADRMTINYGEKNEIQSFHTDFVFTPAATETYPSDEERAKKKQGLATAFTSSRTVDATFDEKGQLKFMKQADNFQYTEGDRKAQSDSATLQNDSNIMDLDRKARISDASGSTTADHIRMQQSTGDFDAQGHAATTRLPESNKSESAMLDKDEPTLGTADHITSANRNHLMHYVGNARVWQSANRIEADNIDIDRDKKSLVADGKVVTWFQDKPKDDAKPAQPVQATFTIVKAPHMVYTDADRLALYTGGVDFWRPTMTIKCATMKAFLNPQDSDADSRVNRAFGDGKVEIVEFVPADHRQRVGNSEHAEYYTEEGKIVLTGGEPKLNDSKRGNTKGDKLTYFTDNNRLEIEGAPDSSRKAQSHLRKKT